LLRDVWLPDPGNDELTWRALDSLTEWDAEAVEVACVVLRRTPINQSAVMYLASRVSESAPALAPLLVAESLKRQIDELERQPDPEPEPLPEGADEEQMVVRQMTHEPKLRFRRVIEDHQDWHGLHEIAAAAPAEFLDVVWPQFIRALTPLLREVQPHAPQFRPDYCLGLNLLDDAEDGRESPLPDAIAVAISSLAEKQPQRFIKFLEHERGRDSYTVQRLLARGLRKLAVTEPATCLRFLVEDPRRLELGSHEDKYCDTLGLIGVLTPRLSAAQVGELETAILRWKVVTPDKEVYGPKERRYIGKMNRKYRLRLLKALPYDLLTSETKQLLPQEIAVFPDHEESGVSRIRGGLIDSPMSADQMGKAKDADILRLFQELPDSTGSHHPREMLQGGSYQASQAFAEFAKAHPARALNLIRQFEPSRQERPAGAALTALAETDLPDTELFRAILDLDKRGFSSEEFRVDAARGLERRLKDGVGLPDEVCQLLERWLAGEWQVREGGSESPDEKDEQKPQSVLWQRDGFLTLPFGRYFLLHALTYGYLLRRPPDADQWLSALEAHLERAEGVRAWQVLARDLRYLGHCDRDRAVRFLDRLFDKYPAVLASEFGAALLTHAWSFVPQTSLWNWMHTIRHGAWPKGPQTFGELLTLRAVLYPQDERACRELENVLSDAPDTDVDISTVRVGVGFTCVHLWSRPDVRQAVTEVVLKLMPRKDPAVSFVLIQLISLANDLPPDDATHRVLAALGQHPHHLAEADNGWFMERFEALLPNEAEAVYKLCREIVRLQRDALGSIRTAWAAHAANLTTIALTLQRLDQPYREMGLELFESLLELHLPDTEATLRELDRRPEAWTTASAGRRRTRSRGRRRKH
jgi:hypothetical protein